LLTIKINFINTTKRLKSLFFDHINNGDKMKVLITGARSGIGFLTGITLANRGHFVYMTTHTKEEAKRLKEITDELRLKVMVFKLDITNINDRKMVNVLDIDVLINHAGVGVGGSVLDVPIEEMRKNFEVNYFSSFDIVKRVGNRMIKNNKNGKIIIMSSISGITSIPFLGVYSSTKAAISNMATSLRYELKMLKSKIKVVLIEPGAYKTGFNQVMIDGIDKNINENSVFYNDKEKIYTGLNKMFNFIEKKKIDSIVVKIIEAVESDNPKAKYRAPLLQRLFTRIYLIFSK